MSGDNLVAWAAMASLGLLALALILTAFRIMLGPSLADRVLGLDMLVSVGIGFIAVIGIKTGIYLYLDIAIALALVGFLATVAFARFILRRGREDEALPTTQVDSGRQP